MSHPAYYFNNVGLMHLKMGKYALAAMYLSKALKYTEKSNDKYVAHPAVTKNSKLNPNEFINNQAAQKTQEILFNQSMALFRQKKYELAFKAFEKLSLGTCSQNPKLWYMMGICALEINKKLWNKQSGRQSEVYHKKLGYPIPHYVKQHAKQK